MNLYTTIAQTLGVLTIVALSLGVLQLGVLLPEGGRRWLRDSLGAHPRHPITWAWVVAATAMSGSLYFSEVAGFAPCMLCWYQRIAMYPLVLVLGVGVIRGDLGVWRFAMPLSVVGFVIAGYHAALQLQPSLELVPCSTGVSCSARYVAVFGWVSIPVMAAGAFFLISALLVALAVLELGEADQRVYPATAD